MSTSSERTTLMRLAIGDTTLIFARTDALDLLTWLGLDAPEFGAIAAGELAARCRRRLWPLPRNIDPAIPGRRAAGTLRAMTERVLSSCDELPREASVRFG